MLQYRAMVHREDGQFWIELPDFPEITHHGILDEENPADAAAETLADAIILRLEEGETLPEPSAMVVSTNIEQIIVAPRKKALAAAAE
jgi:predicted RNase H-like HicB family nuclease